MNPKPDHSPTPEDISVESAYAILDWLEAADSSEAIADEHLSPFTLDAYHHRLLTTELLAETDAHLTICADCRIALDEFRVVLADCKVQATQSDSMMPSDADAFPFTVIQGGNTEAAQQKPKHTQGDYTLPLRVAALERPAPLDSLPFHQANLSLTGKASPSPLNLDGASILWLRALGAPPPNASPSPVRATWPGGCSETYDFSFYEKKQRWTVTIDIPMPWPMFMKLLAEGQVIVEHSPGK